MKRIVACFLVGILMLTGCVKIDNAEQKTDISRFYLSYVTDTSKYKNKYSITIDYNAETPLVELRDFSADTVTEIYISDRINLDAYLDKLKNDPDLFRFDYKIGDTDLNKWYLQIDTEENSYCNGGIDFYPEFWDEFWQIMIDTTLAESKTDLGFVTTVDELGVNEKEYVEQTDAYAMRLKYPKFVGDYHYVKINDLIIDSILDLPIYDINNYSDLSFVNFNGEYKIIRMKDGIVSIKYQASATVKGSARPTECCFGITINLETGELVKLEEEISYEEILTKIQNAEYTVEFGTLDMMTVEQVQKEFEESIISSEYDTYTNNFYIGVGSLYVVIDGIIGSDYGIIRIME